MTTGGLYTPMPERILPNNTLSYSLVHRCTIYQAGNAARTLMQGSVEKNRSANRIPDLLATHFKIYIRETTLS